MLGASSKRAAAGNQSFSHVLMQAPDVIGASSALFSVYFPFGIEMGN